MLKPVTQRVGPVWWVQVGLCRAIWRGGAFPRRASMNPDFLPNEMKGMRAIENHVCGLLLISPSRYIIKTRDPFFGNTAQIFVCFAMGAHIIGGN